MDFFLRKPAGIRDGLLDILDLEIRISVQDFLERGVASSLPDDDRNRNAPAPNASPGPPWCVRQK